MQTLNARTVLRAARKYATAGKLGFQTAKVDCRYDYSDGSRCSMGAAMNKKARAAGDLRGGRIDKLVHLNIVRIPTSQLQDLCSLQTAHDEACTGRSRATDRRVFYRLLRRLETKYGLRETAHA